MLRDRYARDGVRLPCMTASNWDRHRLVPRQTRAKLAARKWNLRAGRQDIVFEFEAWQWVALGAGAFLIGLTKTGLPGLGILVVTLFALAMPPKVSTGAILPLLLVGDLFAVSYFRRRADWRSLLRLVPATVVGVYVGYRALAVLDNRQVGRLIGGIIVGLMMLQVVRERGSTWRQHPPGPLLLQPLFRILGRCSQALTAEGVPHRWWFAASFGMAAGFTTMVSNAAGPITIVYLLAVGLPKVTFMGTAAWFYLLINAFKVPFSGKLGLINAESLWFNLKLAPVVVVGAVFGTFALRWVPEKVFRHAATGLATAAGLKLLIWP